jgi:hypothetical protein
MRRKAESTRRRVAKYERSAEPRATTAAANWWERELGVLLRESEVARRKDGRLKFDNKNLIYMGYPPRYQYEGAMYGEYVASYLNNAVATTRKGVNVRLFAFTSLSILRAENHDEGAKRIIDLVEQLSKLNAQPPGTFSKELIDDVGRILAFYADRQVVFADSGQSQNATKRGIVFQREPLDFVVLDSVKLRKSVALLGSALHELEEDNCAATARQKLRECAELVDEATERGPSAHEHRMHYYVLELFERGLLGRLRRCGCSCGCGRWIYQRRHTHRACDDCRASSHVKDQETREHRNRQARQRYRLQKGNVK